MAPWPEQGNELKNIDKVNEIRSSSFDETQNHQIKSENFDEKGKLLGKSEEIQDPHVSGLDEGQLKALLDEALQYKTPKDREGKSDLFKKLLQEVAADEKEDLSLKNQINSATNNARFNRNRRQHISSSSSSSARHISERQRSGGSLQNLVCAYSAELEAANNKRRNKNLRGSNCNVSARQREGGSLPSNVNHVQRVSGVSNNLFDDYKRSKDLPGHSPVDDKVSSESGLCTDYSSSTNCHSRKTSSTWGDEDGIELEDMRGSSRTYTTRATLELSTGSDSTQADMSGGGGCNSDIDTSVLFPLKPKTNSVETSTPLSLNSTYNSVKCLINLDSNSINNTTSNSTGLAKSDSGSNVVSTLSIPPQQRIKIDSSSSTSGHTDTVSTATFTDVSVNTQAVSMLLSPRGDYPCTQIPSHVLHLSEPLGNYTASYAAMEKCKAGNYDENGNALNQLEKKKHRRAKTKNEKNTYLAETVDGFLGDKTINELLLFIENDDGHKKKTKIPQKHKKTKDDSEHPKKRKGKEKLTKCNSLEEISKTKLEDLTASSSISMSHQSTHLTRSRLKPKKQVTLDDEQLRWHTARDDDNGGVSSDEAATTTSTVVRKRKDLTTRDHSVSADETILHRKRKETTRIRDRDGGDKELDRKTDDESEFRLVQTKKHRRKKRRSMSSHNDQMGQTNVYRHKNSPDHHRTSSMPPSDRSDCSDLDSVHSLPITTSVRERRTTTSTPTTVTKDYKTTYPTSSPSFGSISISHKSKTSSCHSSCNSVHESGGGGASSGTTTQISTPIGNNNEDKKNHIDDTKKNNLIHTNSQNQQEPPLSNSNNKNNILIGAAHDINNTSDTFKRNNNNNAIQSTNLLMYNNNSSYMYNNNNNLNSNNKNNNNTRAVTNTISTSTQKHNNDIEFNNDNLITARVDNNNCINLNSNNNRQLKIINNSNNNNNNMFNGNNNNNLSTDNNNDDYETITLALNINNNKSNMAAPLSSNRNNNSNRTSLNKSTISNNNNNNNADCDVYVEFNLPAPNTINNNNIGLSKQIISNTNNNYSNHNDVTVEKTVIVKSQHCTGISESVSLIIPPPLSTNPINNITNTNITTKKLRSQHQQTHNNHHQPPVILMDQPKDQNNILAASDLIFGFEINKQLLSKDINSSGKNIKSITPVTVETPMTKVDVGMVTTTNANKIINETTTHIPVVSANSCLNLESDICDMFNYTEIVNFVGNAWNEVMRDLNNSKSSSIIAYYTTNSHSNSTTTTL